MRQARKRAGRATESVFRYVHCSLSKEHVRLRCSNKPRARGRTRFTRERGGAGAIPRSLGDGVRGVEGMADPLGGLDLRIDPWGIEQGGEVTIDAEAVDGDAHEVDMDVEVEASSWAALRPVAGVLPESVCFVDGVRRIDLRVMRVVRDSLGIARVGYGGFGSFAVGAVEVLGDPRKASFHSEEVGRCLVVGGGDEVPDVVLSEGALSVIYLGEASEQNEPTTPQVRLHRRMRLAEERFGRALADALPMGQRLVVMDGPLSFEDKVKGLAVGAVKRLHELYVPREKQVVLEALGPGERTPMFHIGGRYPRYSWFLRLSATGPHEPPWSGLMRMEVHDAIGREASKRLADLTASALPVFAPSRAADPRAPQNLLPIGALEMHLRRALGDATLLRRQLESLVRSRRAEERRG